MVFYPEHLKYSPHHVWVRVEKGVAVVGITDDVQEELEAIESVDVPMIGDELEVDSVCMSFHLRAELYDILSPLTGRVVETNKTLLEHPDEIFVAPYTTGWLFKMEFDEPEELELLLDAEDYGMLFE